MKKTLVILGLVVVGLAVGGLIVLMNARSRSPRALLDKLAKGKGDREELIMKLNVASGDVVGPMMQVVNDKSRPASFRADVLELLIKRNSRAPERRVEQVILAAAKDPELVVRRKAVSCIAVYADDPLRVALVDSIEDPDPEIRLQVYLTMSAADRHDLNSGVWKVLSDQQKEKLIQSCQRQVEREETEEMRLYARGVIGREIETLGTKSQRAFLASDVAGAERLLEEALALDPQNCQAQIRLVRFYLRIGQREKALDLARQYGGLFEIPLLRQAPEIDGDPSEPVWSEAFTTEKFYHTTSRWIQWPPEGRSKAHIGHRDGKIYIAVIGYEEDLGKLVMSNHGRDSNIWLDDCVELIFDPDNTDSKFYQFIINPVGALYDSSNEGRGKNYECKYAAKVFEDRGYWACEFALDGEDLDKHSIEPGTIWSMNVFRVRIGADSEHCGIWPLFGWAHRLDIYPLAIFK